MITNLLLNRYQDDHITSTLFQFMHAFDLYADTSLEPLRRADLLNAINKLAGERGSHKIQHLMRRPLAINNGGAAYNGTYNGSGGYGGSYNLSSY
jgi:hypothetical protein